MSPLMVKLSSVLIKHCLTDCYRNNLDVGPGDFAENLTCEGIDLVSLPVGTRVLMGKEIVLEISQIGKCIMPKEGVFSEVIKGGLVRAGDEIRRTTKDGHYK